VRCYSLRANGGAAGLCRALATLAALKGNAAVRAALRRHLAADPDRLAGLLTTEQQAWVLSKTEEIMRKDWLLADATLALVELFQRAVIRMDAPSAAGTLSAEHDISGFSQKRARARRTRDDLARSLVQVSRALTREWRRPFASAIANANAAQARASGTGE
jgi:hypothetical protein